MNVDVLPSGELRILPPRSRAGDRVVLRAEMDLIVGVTACSAELSNNGRFKPIDVRLHADRGSRRGSSPRRAEWRARSTRIGVAAWRSTRPR